MGKVKEIVMVLACLVSFQSCWKLNVDFERAIVGTWKGNGYTYVFEKNGKGYELNTTFDIKSNFTWSATETQINFVYDGSGNHVAGSYMRYYTINGNSLNLWYSDGEFQGAYTK